MLADSPAFSRDLKSMVIIYDDLVEYQINPGSFKGSQNNDKLDKKNILCINQNKKCTVQPSNPTDSLKLLL